MPFFSPSDGGVFGILWSLGVAALRLFLYPIKALQSKKWDSCTGSTKNSSVKDPAFLRGLRYNNNSCPIGLM